ncbi:MAG: hypothetical protein ABIH36_03040 [bacterium]
MAWQTVGALLENKKTPLLDEGDVRHFVECYLRERLVTDALYCREVKEGRAWVRAGSPTLQQEACLLEYDVGQALAQELDYTLRSLKVTQW